MTSGSLGLRTGSYGSLQQQQYLQNAVMFSDQPLGIVRKSSKMLLSCTREKERFRPRLYKLAGRRRFEMLLLVVVSLAVCISLFAAVNKARLIFAEHADVLRQQFPFSEDDDSEIVPHHTRSIQINKPNCSIASSYPEPFPVPGELDKKENSSWLLNLVPISSETKAQPPPPTLPVVMRNTIPPRHPCDKFTLPPPPTDKKRIGPRPCPVCYLPVEQAIAFMPKAPSASPVLRNLTYVYEEKPVRTEVFGGSEFGGYPSLKQRNNSFDIKESMNVHCGFVRGSKPGRQTGFDIDDSDLLEMDQCHGIVVASAIFGNYDIIQQPMNISQAAKENVCFCMFVDEETEAYIKNSSALDSCKKVGLWRIVVVKNLPYVDARRNGKIPKLLLHRIFPNARFSIWIDGKLELVVDPYQILERFLWRKNANFAISRHYRRFDVFDEAEANKAAGKYDNASVNFQIDFYKREGLTPYSTAKLPITSDVPEGCVIIKEHIPISNLFTCLWFNEVDRFTSRDQISFSTPRDKIMSKVNWSINMFLDCERRNFVVQAYHRDLLELMTPPIPAYIHHPPTVANEPPGKSSSEIVIDTIVKTPARKNPTKRGRDRRSGSRHHRKIVTGNRDNNSI